MADILVVMSAEDVVKLRGLSAYLLVTQSGNTWGEVLPVLAQIERAPKTGPSGGEGLLRGSARCRKREEDAARFPLERLVAQGVHRLIEQAEGRAGRQHAEGPGAAMGAAGDGSL